jgi:gamma-glutamylcyclotransferase (GGCT)/AIG2-like uncharacterized protein YtfP
MAKSSSQMIRFDELWRKLSSDSELKAVLATLNVIGVHRLNEPLTAETLDDLACALCIAPDSGGEFITGLTERFRHPERRLAVYGTLVPGGPNFSKISQLTGSWRSGTVHGTLEAQGWGAESGYPGLRWDPDSKEKVVVHVLESEMLSNQWSMLDDFEGSDYRRIWVPVEFGSRIDICNLYALPPQPQRDRPCRQ